MIVFAVDPGNIESGYAVVEFPDFKLLDFGKVDNEELLSRMKKDYQFSGCDHFVCEMIASYGMSVGKSVFDTCVWIGRFWEAMGGAEYVYRAEEKMTLCHSMKAKDANIRQALIDRYAKFDFQNGKGTKKNPDTFYGVSKDAWSAVAVAVAYYEREKSTKE